MTQADPEKSRQPIDKKHKNKKGKSGCLLLLISGIAFIVLVYAIMIFSMTSPDINAAKQNALKEIRACEKENSQITDSLHGYYRNESCAEMVKQFNSRFKQSH